MAAKVERLQSPQENGLERFLSGILSQLKRDTDQGLAIISNRLGAFTKTVENISASESKSDEEKITALRVTARLLQTIDAMTAQATVQAENRAKETNRKTYLTSISDKITALQAVLLSRGLTMPNLEEAMETTLASMGSTAEHRAVETTANAEVLNRADELGLRSRLLPIIIALLFLFGADTEAKGKQAIDLDLMPAGIPALIQELQSFAAEMRAEIDLAAMDTQEALLEFLQVESFGELQQNLSIAFGALQGGQQNGPEGDATAMGGGVDRDEQVGTQEAPAQPTVIVNQGSNIRLGKSTNSSIVGRAAAGDTFEFISRDGDWVQIRMENGETGFIYHTLVTVETPVAPSTPAPEVAQLPLQLTNTPETTTANRSLFTLETTSYDGSLGTDFQASSVTDTFLREISIGLDIETVVQDYNLSSETITAIRYFGDLEGVIEGNYGAQAHVELAAVDNGSGYTMVPQLKVDQSFIVSVNGVQLPVGEGSVFFRNDAGEMELVLIDSVIDGSVLTNAEIVPKAFTPELRSWILNNVNGVDDNDLPPVGGIVFVQVIDPMGGEQMYQRIVINEDTLITASEENTPNEDIARLMMREVTGVSFSDNSEQDVESRGIVETLLGDEIFVPATPEGPLQFGISSHVDEFFPLVKQTESESVANRMNMMAAWSYFEMAQIHGSELPTSDIDVFLNEIQRIQQNGGEVTFTFSGRTGASTEPVTGRFVVPTLLSFEGSGNSNSYDIEWAQDGTQIEVYFTDRDAPVNRTLTLWAGSTGSELSLDRFIELDGGDIDKVFMAGQVETDFLTTGRTGSHWVGFMRDSLILLFVSNQDYGSEISSLNTIIRSNPEITEAFNLVASFTSYNGIHDEKGAANWDPILPLRGGEWDPNR